VKELEYDVLFSGVRGYAGRYVSELQARVEELESVRDPDAHKTIAKLRDRVKELEDELKAPKKRKITWGGYQEVADENDQLRERVRELKNQIKFYEEDRLRALRHIEWLQKRLNQALYHDNGVIFGVGGIYI
jgi:chromosome segregation ATPase